MSRRLSAPPFMAVMAIVGLAIVVAGAAFDLRAAAAAWLLATFVSLGLSAGAISLLLAGKLTGGAWIEALAPVLRPAALAVPIMGLAFIPLLFVLPHLFPWAAEGAKNPSVGALYLNVPLLVLRLVLGFAGWTLLAFLAIDIEGHKGQVAAGIGLVFHVVMTTFFAYDWIMALQPAFTSSVFGAHTAIMFLLSALCLGGLFAPLPDGKPRRDIGGLIIAGVLGVVYIGFMQFLIIWYGDLSDTTKFYLDRASDISTIALIAALVMGGLVPLVMLVPPGGRSSAGMVRAASFFVLAGILLYWGWCVCALFGPVSVVLAPAVFLVLICAAAVFAPLAERRRTMGAA